MKDRRRRHILQQLETEASEDRRFQLATELADLGGYYWRGGKLRLVRHRHTLNDNRYRVEKFGGVDGFVRPFFEVLPGLKPDAPDWDSITRLLMREGGISHRELMELTLPDIRAIFLGIAERRTTGTRPHATKRRKPVPDRPLSERENKVWELRKKGLTFKQIGIQLGISKQAASKAFYRVEEFVELNAGRSAAAKYSLRDSDQPRK